VFALYARAGSGITTSLLHFTSHLHAYVYVQTCAIIFYLARFHARQSDRDHSPCSYPDWRRCPLPQPKYTCRSSPSEEMTIFICQQGGRASERPSRSKVLYDCLIDVADHAICEVALQGARDVTALGEWAAFYVLSLTK
jgi:hypothetical protein